MPNWIRRWVKRVRIKFPDCKVICKFDINKFGYVLWVKYKDYSCGILLNPNKSPSVRQNRKWFREYADKQFTEALKINTDR